MTIGMEHGAGLVTVAVGKPLLALQSTGIFFGTLDPTWASRVTLSQSRPYPPIDNPGN